MIRREAFSYQSTLLTIIILLCSITTAEAECMFFSPEHEIPRIPLIVEATVIKANNDNQQLSECAARVDCIFKAEVEINRILKGVYSGKTFKTEYAYWEGCPGVDTFRTDEKRIFFLNADGTLYGKSCGFSGSPLQGEYADTIRMTIHKSKGSPS